MLSTTSGFDVCNRPALEPSKRPALIILCAERITVDAREKGNDPYDALHIQQVASSLGR